MINNLKAFIHERLGSQVEYKTRIFYITCACGLAASASSWLMTLFTPIPYISKAASFFCMAIMLLVAGAGAITKRSSFFSVIICIILNLILFPMTFFFSGGMYSGMPIYFVMGAFFIAMLTSGIPQLILFAVSMTVYAACLFAGWYYPGLVLYFSPAGSVGDIISTVLVVSSATFVITVMTMKEYTKYYDKVTALNTELEMLAKTDSLTKLYNRGYLIDYVTELIEKEIPFHIALFDLDDFKKINDDFGHVVGDNVLINMARIMKEESASGIVARYGGEEFMIVIPGHTDAQMLEIAENIRRKAENELKNSCSRTVTVSGGVYCYVSGETVDSLIEAADRNMYSAKRTGKNRIISRMSLENEESIQ